MSYTISDNEVLDRETFDRLFSEASPYAPHEVERVGGLETLKDKVKYVQIEFNILNGGIKQFVDLLTNFNFYLMVEPQLLNFLEKLKTQNVKNVYFNKSLIKLDENIIKYVDETILPTDAGGNIFGVRKDLPVNNNLFFKII